jgi:hypothetical protein
MYLVGVRPHRCRRAEEVLDVAKDDVSRQAIAREPIFLNLGSR